ncbi:MAG: c-type cytochrome domain-containing protein [Caldilineaceae bacterium]
MHFLRHPVTPVCVLVLILALLTASCVNSQTPATAAFTGFPATVHDPADAPPFPFQNPNILGIEQQRSSAVTTLEGALACLSTDKVVYGLALENSNVRAEPMPDACRMGRTPRGRVVRVTGVYAEDQAEPLSSLKNVGGEVGYTLGYDEDIYPIFNQNCNSCHGAVAQINELQVTDYDALLKGSVNGPVVEPGDAENSRLWEMVSTGKMPLIGQLSDEEKSIIEAWINAGAPQRRSGIPRLSELWLALNPQDVDLAPNAACAEEANDPQTLVNGRLLQFLSCGVEPDEETIAQFLTPEPAANSSSSGSTSAAPAAAAPAASGAVSGNIAPALGLAPPSDGDPFLIPQGGFCIEQRLSRLANQDRSITALAFAPDGRLFMALDASPTGQRVDPLVLLDAFHPSRSIVVHDSNSDGGYGEILTESPRVTGLNYYNGALYVSRSGEVGRIPDGGGYEKLAGGFAVQSQLFHANNGIVVSDGWVYVSAGGVRDGWSDGPLENIGEDAAQNIVSGGSRLAARIMRAPLDQLLSERSINNFQTAARGVRNPYGIARAPDGRIWFTDNGSTNVPEGISAGDELNVFDPSSVPGGTAESATPYYGFPLALTGANPGWRAPVIALPNTAAPTSVTWAYGAIFYGQYGRQPGLYRLGRAANGQVISERVMLVWPLISLATAPDGALWIGTGTGGLYRMTPGCG